MPPWTTLFRGIHAAVAVPTSGGFSRSDIVLPHGCQTALGLNGSNGNTLFLRLSHFVSGTVQSGWIAGSAYRQLCGGLNTAKGRRALNPRVLAALILATV